MWWKLWVECLTWKWNLNLCPSFFFFFLFFFYFVCVLCVCMCVCRFLYLEVSLSQLLLVYFTLKWNLKIWCWCGRCFSFAWAGLYNETGKRIWWRRLVWLGLVPILVNNHLDAQFFFCLYLFQFSTCFEHPSAYQENQLYEYDIWCVSLCVGDRRVCRFGWNSSIQTCTLDGHLYSWHIPDIVLVKSILLMMSTGVLETCRNLE
jgi:hypothetical protein